MLRPPLLRAISPCGATACSAVQTAHIVVNIGLSALEVLDLEGEANHRGSNFGGIHDPGNQPSQENYANQLAVLWSELDSTAPVLLEDEARSVGRVAMPDGLWAVKEAALHGVTIELEFEARITRLVAEYGGAESATLLESGRALKKRLGNSAAYAAEIEAGNIANAARIVTRFYDKKYDAWAGRLAARNLEPRNNPVVQVDGDEVLAAADEVYELVTRFEFNKNNAEAVSSCDAPLAAYGLGSARRGWVAVGMFAAVAAAVAIALTSRR